MFVAFSFIVRRLYIFLFNSTLINYMNAFHNQRKIKMLKSYSYFVTTNKTTVICED